MINEFTIELFNIMIYMISLMINHNKINNTTAIILSCTMVCSLFTFINDAFFYSIGSIFAVVSITINTYISCNNLKLRAI